MFSKLSLSLLLGSLLLTACTPSATMAQKAGKAMAETLCLRLERNTNIENLGTEIDNIIQDYGFEKAADIQTYLDSIKDTEDFNKVITTVRDTLNSECGATLSKKGMDASSIANTMVNR